MPYGYAQHQGYTGSSDTPFQWLGGYGVYYDSDTDLHLTLYRAYSSKMKRFISADPLGIDGGVNVYAMANLNPLRFIDPYGLSGLESGSLCNSVSSFGNYDVFGPLSYSVNYRQQPFSSFGKDLLYGTEGFLRSGANLLSNTFLPLADLADRGLNAAGVTEDVQLGFLYAASQNDTGNPMMFADNVLAGIANTPRWLTSLAISPVDDFFANSRYSTKVLRQMNKVDDAFHAFPSSVDAYAAKYGTVGTQTGADGATYQWLRMRGGYKDTAGTFEYIKDSSGVINHRYLRKD